MNNKEKKNNKKKVILACLLALLLCIGATTAMLLPHLGGEQVQVPGESGEVIEGNDTPLANVPSASQENVGANETPGAEPSQSASSTVVAAPAATRAPAQNVVAPVAPVEPSEEPAPSVEPSEEPAPSVEPSEEPAPSVEPSEEPKLSNTQQTLKDAKELAEKMNACASYDEKRELLGVTGAAGNDQMRDYMKDHTGILTLESSVAEKMIFAPSSQLYIQTYFVPNSNTTVYFPILYASKNSGTTGGNRWEASLVYNQDDGNWYEYIVTNKYNGKLETFKVTEYGKGNTTWADIKADLANADRWAVVSKQKNEPAPQVEARNVVASVAPSIEPAPSTEPEVSATPSVEPEVSAEPSQEIISSVAPSAEAAPEVKAVDTAEPSAE